MHPVTMSNKAKCISNLAIGGTCDCVHRYRERPSFEQMLLDGLFTMKMAVRETVFLKLNNNIFLFQFKHIKSHIYEGM
jgi:hypothetical protein